MSLIRYLRRASRVVVPVSLLGVLMSHAGWLDGWEMASVDFALKLQPMSRVEHVVIAGIDDMDYERIFQSRSPLDREALGALLIALARGQPAAIAVDLETQPFNLTELGRRAQTVEWPPVMWATTAEMGEDGLLRLGSKDEPAAPFGVALVPMDSDGLIRRHQRWFARGPGQARVPSLAWATVEAYCASSQVSPATCGAVQRGGDGEAEDLLLNFVGDRYAFPRLSAQAILSASKGPGWVADGPVRGKIVLIGGTYRAARDLHVTPAGPMAGVEIMAQAVESELQGTGIRLANKVAMLGAELTCGYLIALAHHLLAIRWATLLSLLAIPVLSIASSLAAFFSVSRWANFVPVLIAALIHQLYESAKRGKTPEESRSTGG